MADADDLCLFMSDLVARFERSMSVIDRRLEDQAAHMREQADAMREQAAAMREMRSELRASKRGLLRDRDELREPA